MLWIFFLIISSQEFIESMGDRHFIVANSFGALVSYVSGQAIYTAFHIFCPLCDFLVIPVMPQFRFDFATNVAHKKDSSMAETHSQHRRQGAMCPRSYPDFV